MVSNSQFQQKNLFEKQTTLDQDIWEQAGLSWGSVQAETVRLQSWIESGLIDICWNLLN